MRSERRATHSKVDPSLERELEALRAGGLWDRVIPVLIEAAAKADVPRGGDRRTALAAMERQVAEFRAALLSRLGGVNAKDVQPLQLVNAVTAELTLDQVWTVAKDPRVRMVRLARPELVSA